MTMLDVWQTHYGYTDRQAADLLALSPSEFARQRATKPSRQTCLIAILITMYRPDMAAIAKAAAALDRPPARPEEPGPNLSSGWS
jgi:hypothetical protein